MAKKEKPWVLVAEDTQTVRDMLCRVVGLVFGENIEVVGVGSVNEGLEALNKHRKPPQSVLVDVFSNGKSEGEVDEKNTFLPLPREAIRRGTRRVTIFGASEKSNNEMANILRTDDGGDKVTFVIETKPGRYDLVSNDWLMCDKIGDDE